VKLFELAGYQLEKLPAKEKVSSTAIKDIFYSTKPVAEAIDGLIFQVTAIVPYVTCECPS
jgi:hypothetical protein